MNPFQRASQQAQQASTQVEHEALDPNYKRAQLAAGLERLGAAELGQTFQVVAPRSVRILDKFITQDEDTLRMLEEVRELAERHESVLIHGETGTGKEMIAQALHGYKKEEKFVAINTTSLPDTLLESELFGHVKGSFTGASEDRVGKLVAASDEKLGGTVFLDEIGDMKPNLQEKLLRALQERVVTPVGSNKEVRINCRVIAATHKVIRYEIPAMELSTRSHREEYRRDNNVEWLRGFREDLYWRLATHIVTIKPLRDRPSDIGLIIEKLYADRMHLFSDEFVNELRHLKLTGNVRELMCRCEREMFREAFELKFASKYRKDRVSRHMKNS